MKMQFVAGAAAAFLMTAPAQAAVVTFNTPIAVPNTGEGVYINFATGAAGYSYSNPPAGWDFNAFSSEPNLTFFWNLTSHGVANAASIYQGLAPGAVVSSTSTFRRGGGASNAQQFFGAGDHVLGFRFLNESTGAANYGYLTMTSGGGSGFPATITGWSYDDTGAAITVASAVPEPATWAMMIIGFGAVGSMVRASRRRNVFSAA